ncbi:MAG: hypothetical protein ACTJHT_15295 [Sphingobacterium sp.]
MDIIPQNFAGWKVCIEKKCGITLTSEFAAQRLARYEDESLTETRRFVKLYGQEHLLRIKSWFRQIIDQEIETRD